MNIVYKVIFTQRIANNIKPYYYIGSKSNCIIKDGLIYDKDNKVYFGSSHYDEYDKIVKTDKCIVEILYIADTYSEALLFERDIQIENDVVASTEYFNLSIATINNFTDPEYATYKHIHEGKIVRLKRDHPLVKNGIYVGVTKCKILSSDECIKCGLSGSDNAFFGKHHTVESKTKISESKTGKSLSNTTKQKMSDSRKGVKKTDEHKAKLGRKNLIMLKNINTGECIRINKIDKPLYDESIWMNPYTVKCKTENVTFKHSDDTKSKIGRKGFIMLKNINTGENIRISKDDSSKYDKDIWMNPATVKKILKERNK